VFAPKAVKPQTKAAEDPTGSLALQRSKLAGHRLGHDPVEQALLLQRTIGNQAIQRLPAQQASRAEQEAAPETMAALRERQGLAWDFSKIPVLPPDRASQSRPSFAPSAAPLPGAIQARLIVGPSNDPLEQEADRAASQVMRMPDPAVALTPAPRTLRLKCACEEERKRQLQTKSEGSPSAAAGGEAPPIVQEVLQSAGQPLDGKTRSFMEARFGHDFSRVRVHTDARASESARAVNALAYTVGDRIAFRTGHYAPQSSDGRKLLAHELAHVAQQSRGGPAPNLAPSAPHEQEARAAATAVGSGLPCVQIVCNAAPGLARMAGPRGEREIIQDLRRVEGELNISKKAVDDFLQEELGPDWQLEAARRNRIRPMDIRNYVLELERIASRDARARVPLTGLRNLSSRLHTLNVELKSFRESSTYVGPANPPPRSPGADPDIEAQVAKDTEANIESTQRVRFGDTESAPRVPDVQTPTPDVQTTTPHVQTPEPTKVELPTQRPRVDVQAPTPDVQTTTPTANTPTTPEAQTADVKAPTYGATAADEAVDIARTGLAEKALAGAGRAVGTVLEVAAEAAILIAAELLNDWLEDTFGSGSEAEQERRKINRDLDASTPQLQSQLKKLGPKVAELQQHGKVYSRITFFITRKWALKAKWTPSFPPVPLFAPTFEYTGMTATVDVTGEDLGNSHGMATGEGLDGRTEEHYTQTVFTLIDDPEKRKAEKEMHDLNEKMRQATPKTLQPQPPPSQPAEIARVLPPPGPVQSATSFGQSFQPLGPLGSSPRPDGLCELDDWKCAVGNAIAQAVPLLARGERLVGPGGSSSPDIAPFLSDEQKWRDGVTYMRDYYTVNPPEDGKLGLQDVLDNPQYGGRLKEIRRQLGG
jgi:Domain of unknown function (DUF4157)